MYLKNIVEKNDTKAGRIFDLVIQFLIPVSLISFSTETLPGLSAAENNFLRLIEVITAIVSRLDTVT